MIEQITSLLFVRRLDDLQTSAENRARFIGTIEGPVLLAGQGRRLFESPSTDHAPTGPDVFFADADIDLIVEILHDMTSHAVPIETA